MTTRTLDTNNVRNKLFSASSLCLTLYGLYSLEQLTHMAGSFKLTALQYWDQRGKKNISSALIWKIQGRTLSSHMTIPEPFTINCCESYIHSSGQWAAHIPLHKHPPSMSGIFQKNGTGGEAGKTLTLKVKWYLSLKYFIYMQIIYDI